MYTLVLCSAMAIRSILPGPAEMRGHHGQVRVRRRELVELERVRVVDPDALAARLPRADPAGPGVEQGEQAVLLAGREDRPVRGVVGEKACSDGWNFTPRSPRDAMFATSATAASPLCGSTEPRPVNTTR